MMEYKSTDVSVIIPSYNSIKTIGKCLDALTHQSTPPKEIIVIDSSADGTAEFIQNNYPEIRLIRMKKKIFPGPGRNRGARKASGKILAFIDSDCIAIPTWIEQITKRHSEGYKIVGGSIDVGDPTNVNAWCGHIMEFRDYLKVGEARLVGHIPSCNISYSRKVFLDSGGFPESYYPQEDLLLDYLLTLEGEKILFDPSINILHFCRDSLRDFISHQHRIGRVTCCVLKKLNMEGAFAARSKWISRLFFPFLGLVKFFKNLAVIIRHYPKLIIQKPSLIPVLFVGCVWWARGFSAGGDRGLSGIIGWEDPQEPIFSQINTSHSDRANNRQK